MGSKKLRAIIPLIQVLVLILAVAADSLSARQPELRYPYATTLFRVVTLKLNFPLAGVWLAMFYPFSFVQPSSFTQILSPALVLTSTAAFWYFVVVEVERRKRGSSCLRFSSRSIETVKATVLILLGIGAAVYAFWDGNRLVKFDLANRHYYFWAVTVADALVGGLLLLGWAMAFIAIGVQDIVKCRVRT